MCFLGFSTVMNFVVITFKFQLQNTLNYSVTVMYPLRQDHTYAQVATWMTHIALISD